MTFVVAEEQVGKSPAKKNLVEAMERIDNLIKGQPNLYGFIESGIISKVIKNLFLHHEQLEVTSQWYKMICRKIRRSLIGTVRWGE